LFDFDFEFANNGLRFLVLHLPLELNTAGLIFEGADPALEFNDLLVKSIDFIFLLIDLLSIFLVFCLESVVVSLETIDFPLSIEFFGSVAF
jgi:hypothetical protein